MPKALPFSDDERDAFGTSLRLLSAAFHSGPEAPSATLFFHILREHQLGEIWPFGEVEQLEAINATMAAALEPQGLRNAWQRLFIGPDPFEAPAWGSVYLDKENVLFGNSTLELRSFLANAGAVLNTGQNEPEDHIGLILWLASDFLIARNDEALKQLLAYHLLPWSGHYLDLLVDHAQNPFYEGLARLTMLTLTGMVQEMQITPVARPLYR